MDHLETAWWRVKEWSFVIVIQKAFGGDVLFVLYIFLHFLRQQYNKNQQITKLSDFHYIEQ